MKRTNIKKHFAVLLTASMVCGSFSAVGMTAMAEELDNTQAAPVAIENVVETVNTVEPTVETPAPVETETVANEVQQEETKQNDNVAASQPAPAEEEVVVKAAAAEEVKETEAEEEKAVRTDPIKVKITVYGKNESGEYVSVSSRTNTIKTGKSTSLATVSSLKTKEYSIDGTTYVFSNAWTDSYGKSYGSSAKMTYDEAAAIAGDAAQISVEVYAQYRAKHNDVTLTWVYDDIKQANGKVTSKQKTQTIGDGNGSGLKKGTIESATGLRTGQTFKFGGRKYTYTGVWTSNTGLTINDSTAITFWNKDGSDDGSNIYLNGDMTVVFTPVYEVELLQGLDFYYTDQISTGTGSWSNLANGVRSDFSSMTHTFSNPEIKTPVEHYKFVYWQDRATGKTYADGETYTFEINPELEEGAVTTVNIDAWWQPSVTVNYIVDDATVHTEESFEGNLTVNYTAEKENMNFDGWYDADGNLVSEDAVFALPEITTDGEPAVYELHAVFSEIPAEDEPEKKETVVPTIIDNDDDKDDKENKTIVNLSSSTPASVNQTLFVTRTETVEETQTPLTNDAETVEIEETQTPLAYSAEAVEIEETQTPLAVNETGSWALINLLAAIATGLMSLILVIRCFGRKEDQDEEEGTVETINRKRGRKLVSLIPAIGAAIAFILTEDMTLKMQLTDKWTLAMLLILAIQTVVALIAKTKREEEEEDEKQAATVNA